MTDSDDSQYVVLVDIVGSRDISNRGAFARQVEEAMSAVNRSGSAYMSTPLTRMKGIDEFGCVLTQLGPLPDIICSFLDRIHPTLARFGVASGEIDIGRDSNTVAEMDGPAFHRASELLVELESDALFVGVDVGKPTDSLVATALNAFVLAREKLTERQMEVILAYEELGTQTAAGNQLGIPQQAVSDLLSRANYDRRKRVQNGLRQAIEQLYE